jgi:mono/diheme cytochrome c family protein
MPAFDEHLAPESEVADVLSYLDTFAQPTTGKGLFLDYCGNCHGADAKGGTTGHPIMGLTGGFEEAVRQGRNLHQMGSRASYMPRWKEAELSDAEIGAMADYVLALDHTAQ